MFILLVLLAIAVGLISLLLKLFRKPIKWAFKLLCHALSGFVFLFLLNLLGAQLGLYLDMTWLNAIVTGVLGVPGVVLLLALTYIL